MFNSQWALAVLSLSVEDNLEQLPLVHHRLLIKVKCKSHLEIS